MFCALLETHFEIKTIERSSLFFVNSRSFAFRLSNHTVLPMASTSVQQPPQQASKSFGDYIPDDFADFGGLFSEDEQTNAGAKSSSARAQQKNADGTAGLGIDTEVSVKKRAREPRVKLDESR